MIIIGIGHFSTFHKIVSNFPWFQFTHHRLELFILVNGNNYYSYKHVQLKLQSYLLSGTHYKGKNCDPKHRVDDLKTIYNELKNDFFPNEFVFEKVDTGIRALKRSNGGWSDPRDHQLCKSHLNDSFLSLVNITLSKEFPYKKLLTLKKG